MRDVINHPNYALRFMQPGRLVTVKYLDHDFGWGVVVSFFARKPAKGQPVDFRPQDAYIVDVLLCVSESTPSNIATYQEQSSIIMPPQKGEKGKMEVIPVLLSCVESIGHIRLFLPRDIGTPDQRNTVRKSLDEVKKRFPDGIALLDPIENMGITDESFKKLLRVSNCIRIFSNEQANVWTRKSRCSSHGCCRIRFMTLPSYLLYMTSMRGRYRSRTRSRMSRKGSRWRFPSCSWTS